MGQRLADGGGDFGEIKMLAIDTIHCGDCLELMKEIPDKSVDLVLTDPPYFLPAPHPLRKGEVPGLLFLFT